MKKILSLVLAVLMLTSMAISASAVKIVDTSGNGYVSSSSKNDKVTVSDIFDIYDLLDLSLPYGGAINYKGDTIYTWWYDKCPECDGFSFHYVKAGKIFWKCLENDCGKTGVVGGGIIADDKDDDKIDEGMFVGPKCYNCGSYATSFENTVIVFSSIKNKYYCHTCGNNFYVDTKDDKYTDDDYIYEYVICSHYNCNKIAYFDYFFTSNGKLYARYECSAEHTTDKRVYSDINYDFNDYSVYVRCTRGGDYDITGGTDAYYGEVKTIEFYADKGYVLTDVLVDGESVQVGSDNKIKITVKGDTVVRAYFEKATALKDYTVTLSSTGNGKVYVKKNDVAVSSDSVKANYTDTVTYRFVPASANYKVANVKVNGRSVGAPTSYTVSKLSADTKITVTFEWKNPYVDVKDSHEAAVEYVTESGIMTIGTVVNNKHYFNGNVKVSVRSFAEALAEMADTADKLDDTAERIAWADKNGIVREDDDLSVGCDVQTACDMVYAYLRAIEDINDINFEDLDGIKNAKDAAIAIDMVTNTTYEKNRYLNRYDLAAVCYLIAGLEYDAD